MLLMGLALKNIPYINIGKDINSKYSSCLRYMALCVILIRAGLSLDLEILLRLKWILIKLAIFPSLIEAVIIAVLSKFILYFEWQWAFLLGFLLVGVSPSIIVPGMLQVESQNFGVDKGIPTLIIAATSLNNVIIISCFYIILGVIFSTGSLSFDIGRGPLEIFIGLIYGCSIGYFMWYIPSKKQKNYIFYRCCFLLFGGLVVLFGSKVFDLPGAGAVGCLALSFTSCYGWKKQKWLKKNSVSKFMAKIWIIFQPVLFGLIGCEIDVSKLNGTSVGFGVLIILVGFVGRFFATLIFIKSDQFLFKETLFISLAWLSKATVQAALSPLPLEMVKKKVNFTESFDNAFEINLGNQVLSLAIVCILLAAPMGAIFIFTTASKLLSKDANLNVKNVEQESPVNTRQKSTSL